MIVPTLRVGMPLVTLRVTLWDAERPGLHSHAERGNDRVLAALQESNGVQAAAAAKIGISERSFWYRLKKLGIQVDKIVR